ncbi:MAG: transporter substrate-binding domain-containing protein [Spirochaetia bacterium]|jgi:putative lysine transport system substrate-binding protein|nr:transporter substrate-binding domain-containing protein [Spirochaetia bacterium]
MKKFLVGALAIAIACSSVFAQGSDETASSAAPAQKTLRVAMECGYAPYNWTQTDDSNGAVPIADSNDYAYGYDVMMAKLIAEKLGYKLSIVKLDWDSLVPAVQSGSVDCVIAGQSITSERKQMVDFTAPYYYASIVCLTLKSSKYASAKGLSDLTGGTCTSQLGTIWYDKCLPQIKDANILPAQESAPAMLVALESKRVDYICTDMPTAQAALVAYPDMKILDFANSGDDFNVSQEDINIGVSVSKKNPELTKAINGVLATLTVDDFNKMMEQAIAVQPLSK